MLNINLRRSYLQLAGTLQKTPVLFKIGAVATASAIVGSLATAWYYRETVRKLQDVEEPQNLHKSELFDEYATSDHRIPSGSRRDSDDNFDLSEPGTLP